MATNLVIVAGTMGASEDGAMRFHGVVLSAATLLAVACGSSSNAPKSPTVPATAVEATTAVTNSETESGLARSMLLTLADFPPGSVEKPPTAPTAGDPLVACQPSHPPGSTGYADTAEFSRGKSSSDIEERVYVFAAPDAALAWLRQYDTEIDCIVSAINAGRLDTSTATFHAAAREAVTLGGPPSGTSNAYRVKFTVSQSGVPPVGVTIDTAVVVVGRAGYSLDGGPSGYSSEELAPYLERAAAKVSQQLK